MKNMNKQPTGFAKEFEHSHELFNAALEEFIKRGYDQASINTILQEAGMSKGQFYYHFKNKEGLYMALIGVLISRKQAFLASVMKPDDLKQDIFTIFTIQIQYGMQFAQQYPAINRFAESFIKEQGNPIYDRALEVYNFQDNDGIDTLIEMAYERGEFRNDLPLSFIRRVFGYLLTHAVEVADMDRADDFEEQLGYLIKFMQSGLGRDK